MHERKGSTMELTTNKHLFDYEQYNSMIANMTAMAKSGDADAELDIGDVKKTMDSFYDYVNTVDQTETRIKIAYALMEGAELRDAITLYDTSRRRAHECAIASARALNRYARFYNADRIFLGNDEDRYEVADFCLQVTVTMFQSGKVGI